MAKKVKLLKPGGLFSVSEVVRLLGVLFMSLCFVSLAVFSQGKQQAERTNLENTQQKIQLIKNINAGEADNLLYTDDLLSKGDISVDLIRMFEKNPRIVVDAMGEKVEKKKKKRQRSRRKKKDKKDKKDKKVKDLTKPWLNVVQKGGVTIKPYHLELSGRFIDLLRFLDQFKALQYKVIAGPLELTVKNYPQTKLSMTFQYFTKK